MGGVNDAAGTEREIRIHETTDRPPVAGTVQLMTEEPLMLPADAQSGARERAGEMLSRRPWIVPAALLAIGAAYLMVRRRR
jgi:hypothetical protein